MGYISLGILVLTGIILLFSTLFGIKRGRNHSILRLILIFGCIAGAIFLRPVLFNVISNIETEQGTLIEMVMSFFNQGGQPLPEEAQKMLSALIQIVIAFVIYFALFYGLRIISWLIIFPIFKLIIKREENKKRGFGAIIGFIQGIFMVFAVVVPLNGLAVDMNKLASIEMDGKPIIEIPQEIGLNEYQTTDTYKIFDTIGGWYYDMLATAKTENGEEYSMSSTCSAINAVYSTVNSFEEVESAFSALSDGTKTDQYKAQTARSASQTFYKLASTMENLDQPSKEMVDGVLKGVKDFLKGVKILDTDSEVLFNDLTIEKINFSSVASGLDGLADYLESPSTITQQGVEKIVNGIVESQLLLEVFTTTEKLIYDIKVNEEMFKSVINQANITAQERANLKKAFGIN